MPADATFSLILTNASCEQHVLQGTPTALHKKFIAVLGGARNGFDQRILTCNEHRFPGRISARLDMHSTSQFQDRNCSKLE